MRYRVKEKVTVFDPKKGCVENMKFAEIEGLAYGKLG